MEAQIIPLLLDLGEFFQIQDDFLDCFGDPDIMGKQGGDIGEGKCTWLIVQALAKPQLSIEHSRQLELHYGRKEHEAVVKSIYIELQIEKDYATLEEATEKRILERCSKLDEPALGTAIEALAKKIFHRRK